MDLGYECKWASQGDSQLPYTQQTPAADRNGPHPKNPRSNIACFRSYDPTKYVLKDVPQTVISDEAMTPLGPPRLTQKSIGKYLVPITRELDEVPETSKFDELPDAVVDRMVLKDKAFWVSKPGSNAYEITDALHRCGFTSDKILPTPQAVFPRSYQYEWHCITQRRLKACKQAADDSKKKTPLPPHCRDCSHLEVPPYSPFQLYWLSEATQKRWKYYPDLTKKLTHEECARELRKVGLPYKHEACTWYNENFPTAKIDFILRKFAK